MAQVGQYHSSTFIPKEEEPKLLWTEENVVAVLKEMRDFLDGHRTPIANQLYDKVAPLAERGEEHLREMEAWRNRKNGGSDLIQQYDKMISDMLTQKQLKNP
jgi:hypothetical protein